MADPQEIAKWRRAHQNIEVPDAGLMTMTPFPSLWAGDFKVYLAARPGVPPEFVQFVTDISREIAWVYDNWQKAQHDGDPKRLIEDMLNDASSQGEADYSPVRKFLRDFAQGHGIQLPGEQPERPSWMGALGAPVEGQGGDPAMPQPHLVAVQGGITAPPAPMPDEAA